MKQGIGQLFVAVAFAAGPDLHQVRGGAHVFHAARHKEPPVASSNCLGSGHARLEAGAADFVDGGRAHGRRQAGVDGCLPGRGLALAGAQHVAHQHFVE